MICYLVKNLINGKAYIGMTVRSLERRWNSHIGAANRGSSFFLHASMRKHGAQNFSVSVLYEASSIEELMAVERAMIAQYGTYAPGGYNMTTGGEGTRNLPAHIRARIKQKRKSYVTSDETKAKISKTLTGRSLKPETVEKVRAALAGRKRPKEVVEKIRALQIGMKRSPESVAKMKASLTGRKLSPSHVEKYRQRRCSEETKAKMSAALLGVCKSAEHAQNISVGRSLMFARRRAFKHLELPLFIFP